MPTGIYKHKKGIYQHSKETKQKMSLAKKGKILSEEHKKKVSLALKGHRISLETRRKISIAHKGMKASEETRKKLSESHKGYKMSEEQKRKISEANKGRGHKHTTETKEKLRNIMLGKTGILAKNWKGGISFEEYPREFNNELKQRIRKRDNYTCCLCGRTEREELEELNRVLSVNHIDFNKQNCREKNLNTLCCRCNVKINRDRQYWTDYFNLKLI